MRKRVADMLLREFRNRIRLFESQSDEIAELETQITNKRAMLDITVSIQDDLRATLIDAGILDANGFEKDEIPF